MRDVWKENGLSFKLEAQKHEKTIATLNERKARISELLEDGIYPSAHGKERLAEFENQLLAARIARNETRIEQFDVQAVIAYATHFVSNLGRQWFDLAPELRPRFQKLIFPEGASYSRSEGFGTARLGLIFEVNSQSGGDLSRVVNFVRLSWNQFVAELREWQAL